MKKTYNRKPVADFDFEKGEFVKGTDVSKLRALVFNKTPDMHNSTLDLIKTRMTAGEVLKLIQIMDDNPSVVRLFQLFRSLLGGTGINSAIEKASSAFLEETMHQLQMLQAQLEKQEDHDRKIIQGAKEMKISDETIEKYNEVLYDRRVDAFRIPCNKATINKMSARLLLKLNELFQQGLPINESLEIYLQSSEEVDREKRQYYAKYKIKELEHELMFNTAYRFFDEEHTIAEEDIKPEDVFKVKRMVKTLGEMIVEESEKYNDLSTK